MLYSKYTRSHTDESYLKREEFIMPRPKGSKNKPKTGVKVAAKKAAAEEKAAAEARKVEVSSVLDKLLAGGMTADQILEKLQ